MKFVLIGNYGVGNLGDEMLKEYFLKTFPEVEWTVLLANTRFRLQIEEMPRLPFGLHSLLTTSWWKTLSVLRKSDGIVFGGGTLFTDIESVKAPMLWWWHAFWAWIFGKRIILAFQGIGPFRTRIGEWCAQWTVEHAELSIVRDRRSFQRISPWKNKKIVQSFDPVISLFTAEKHTDRTQKMFIIIPRANATQEFFSSVDDLYQTQRNALSGVKIVSLDPHDSHEQEICRKLSQEFQATITEVQTMDQLVDALQDASFIITQRYHGAIAALGMGIPFVAVPQREGDKLAAIMGMHRNEALRQMKEGEAALRNAFHTYGSTSILV